MRLFGMAFTLILLISAACAADTGTIGLSLKEAVDMALRQNSSLMAARGDVEAADASERSARALANPEIVVTPGIAGEAGSEEELFISQPLEINGARKIRSGIARARKDGVQAAARSVEREIIRSVKQTYWDIVQAEQIVALDRESLSLAETLHQAAQRQLDIGSAPGAQVVKTQVELSRARQALARSESDLAQTKSALNTLLGRPADTPFTPADKLASESLQVDETALKAAAQEHRPELAEARSTLAVLQAQVKAVDAQRRPDLAIQARQEKFGGEGGLGVAVSIPIVDWGSIKHGRKSAEAAADAQSKRIDAVRNSVLLDVDSALRQVDRSRKLIDEYEQGVLTQAERLAEMAQKGYQAGATGYLEVLEAQRTLRSVRTEYYTALADYQRALAQLEWAVGTDLPAASGDAGAETQRRPVEEGPK